MTGRKNPKVSVKKKQPQQQQQQQFPLQPLQQQQQQPQAQAQAQAQQQSKSNVVAAHKEEPSSSPPPSPSIKRAVGEHQANLSVSRKVRTPPPGPRSPNELSKPRDVNNNNYSNQPSEDINNNANQQLAKLSSGSNNAQQQEQATTGLSPKLSGAKPKQQSTMNLTRLRRDGRKVPDQYRQVAKLASSPSQISVHSISEYYDTPGQSFYTADDVYAYRGYKKISHIDEGAFGVVYKAVRLSDNLPVALKEVDLSRRRMKRIEEMKRELFVLQKVESKFVVKLIEHFIVGSTLVIILEFCAGRNLTNYLKKVPLPEDEALFLFRQMVESLRALHKMNIAHRDVKLNNFLLDASHKNLKIADFGLSVVGYKRNKGIIMAKSFCGTEPYMAPEINRRNTRGFRQYNPMHSDIWSLGVCLYAMVTRTFPFKMGLSQNTMFRLQWARRWRIPRPLRLNISEDLRNLIWHMLDPEPMRRITLNGILTHPWLTSSDHIQLSTSVDRELVD